MKQNRLPIQILEWILLLSAINVAGCSIIGISINNSEIKNSKNIHFHNNIRKYLAYSLLFYEFSMIPLSSIVAVVHSIKLSTSDPSIGSSMSVPSFLLQLSINLIKFNISMDSIIF